MKFTEALVLSIFKKTQDWRALSTWSISIVLNTISGKILLIYIYLQRFIGTNKIKKINPKLAHL